MEKYTIKRLTFKEKEMERIRPNAAVFAEKMHNTLNLPVYQVLHKDGVYVQCLFIFVYHKNKVGKANFEIVRCMGQTKTKKHLGAITNILSENRNLIQSLKDKDQLTIDYSESA